MKNLTPLPHFLSSIIVLMAAIGASAGSRADFDYPYPGHLPLEERALKIEEAIEKNHISNGIPMPRVLLPPEGKEDNSTAHQEDGTNRSGPLMAMYCYRYAATKDPLALERAKRTALTLEKLERVTGVDGCIARSFNLTDKPQPHEQWFFFPGEWHDSTRFENTRWLGDPSSDSLTRFLYANAVYFDLAADEPEKKRVAALVDRVLTRFIDYNFNLVDVDGKTTLWGNYCPDLPHQPLNALLALAAMKIGGHVVGDPKYDAAYKKLIHEHGYHWETLYGDLPMNIEEGVGWDHDLGMNALYHLMKYEEDPWLRGFYRNSLERFHKRDSERPVAEPFYEFIYKAAVGDDAPADARIVEGLVKWNGAWIEKRSEWMREEGGSRLIEGVWSEGAEKFPRMYWMGRYYGFLEEDTSPDNLPVPKPKEKDGAPEGMILIPAGEFTMGSNIGEMDERPERKVQVPAFYIDRYEVTNAEYARFDPTHIFEPGAEKNAVVGVTWEEANAYANWAGKRLPTEAEWEKAARGTDGRIFPWGNHFVPGIVLNHEGGRVDAVPNGASPYRVEQMAGNVWEWTADWYRPYPGNEAPSIAYGEKYKVIRGGADFNEVSRYRCSCRYYVDPKTEIHGYVIGFRCAKDAD